MYWAELNLNAFIRVGFLSTLLRFKIRISFSKSLSEIVFVDFNESNVLNDISFGETAVIELDIVSFFIYSIELNLTSVRRHSVTEN